MRLKPAGVKDSRTICCHCATHGCTTTNVATQEEQEKNKPKTGVHSWSAFFLQEKWKENNSLDNIAAILRLGNTVYQLWSICLSTERPATAHYSQDRLSGGIAVGPRWIILASISTFLPLDSSSSGRLVRLVCLGGRSRSGTPRGPLPTHESNPHDSFSNVDECIM